MDLMCGLFSFSSTSERRAVLYVGARSLCVQEVSIVGVVWFE